VNDDLRTQEPAIDPWQTRQARMAETTSPKEDSMPASMSLAKALRTPEVRSYLRGLIQEEFDDGLLDTVADAAASAVTEASRAPTMSPHQLQEALRDADPTAGELRTRRLSSVAVMGVM
jgi:uncharacterized Zn finger protein